MPDPGRLGPILIPEEFNIPAEMGQERFPTLLGKIIGIACSGSFIEVIKHFPWPAEAIAHLIESLLKGLEADDIIHNQSTILVVRISCCGRVTWR